MSWPMVKLKDCCKVVGGATPKRNVMEYWDSSDIPWVTPKDISNLDDKYISDAPEYISQKGFDKCATYMLPKGSVLLTSRAPIGNLAIVGEPMCTNQGFKSLVPQEGVCSEYIYYCMLAYSERLKSLGNGATFKEVSKKVVEEFEIPLPPLCDQKRIAMILSQADTILQKSKQALTLSDKFLRSVFLDMFGDPITNSKGWTSEKLGDLCKVGSSKRVFVNEFVESGVPFYRGTEVGKLGNDETIEPSLFISEEQYYALKEQGGVPQLGDLLLPSICPDGRIWQVNHQEPFYFKDGRVLWIKSSQTKVSSDYLRSFLQRIFFANYNSIASGTTFAELKIVALKNIDILLPPECLQVEYSKLMEKATSQITKQLTAINEQTKLFDSLSQRAFCGQL